MEATLVTSETDPAQIFGGKRIAICGFRAITESFLPDHFLSRRNRAET
jgi:hypothetical protein